LNYPIYDKELLAIKTTFETWRYYLEVADAKKTIKVLSDHRNPLYCRNLDDTQFESQIV